MLKKPWKFVYIFYTYQVFQKVLDRNLAKEISKFQEKRKNSSKFVYILAKQCRSYFNLTDFFDKKYTWIHLPVIVFDGVSVIVFGGSSFIRHRFGVFLRCSANSATQNHDTGNRQNQVFHDGLRTVKWYLMVYLKRWWSIYTRWSTDTLDRFWSATKTKKKDAMMPPAATIEAIFKCIFQWEGNENTQ